MKAIVLNLSAWVMLPIMDGFAKYLRAKNTTIGIVTKDRNVESTTTLAILSTIFFGEYISAIK